MTVEEKLTFLATRRVTRESMEGILGQLFPKPKNEEGAEKESSTRRKNVLAEVLALYEHNDGNAFPEQRGTAYALLNAVINYSDHLRSSRGGNGTGRAESAIFGSGERLKAQALEVITQSPNGMPTMSGCSMMHQLS